MGMDKYIYVGPMLKVHDTDFSLNDRMANLLSECTGEGWDKDYLVFQANQKIAGVPDRDEDEAECFAIDEDVISDEKRLFAEYLVQHKLEALGDVIWGMVIYWY